MYLPGAGVAPESGRGAHCSEVDLDVMLFTACQPTPFQIGLVRSHFKMSSENCSSPLIAREADLSSSPLVVNSPYLQVISREGLHGETRNNLLRLPSADRVVIG